jgi:transcriptional regulator with XRE-family HTH domain
MRDTKIEIGQTIRERRELLELLQSQLASISGVGLRTIQMVEGGKANPSIETLIKIADPLGLTMQLVLKNTGKINEK